MATREGHHLRTYLITISMVVTIALIAFWGYHEILNYFFTASDSLTLIDTSRIQSSKDVIRILTEPLMNGTQFTDIYRYYRPITTLSFSLDYLIWKINPFGYHLTDLLLHIIVSILVFFTIRSLSGRQSMTAWLGAVLFTIHPVLLESVPANARRQDIVAALFMLLALLAFFNYHKRTLSRKKMPIWSLFFYALSLGAKELAAIVPFMILSYMIVFGFSEERSPASMKAKETVLVILPYVAVTVLFFGWRTYILRGLGGVIAVESSLNPWSFNKSLMEIVSTYGSLLLYPGGWPDTVKALLFSGPIAIFAGLTIYQRLLFGKKSSPGQKSSRTKNSMLIAIGMAILAVMMAYSLLLFFTDQAEDSFVHAVFYSAIWLFLILEYRSIGRLMSSPRSGKLLMVFLVWLFLPLMIYLAAGQMPARGLYVSAIPFSAILSIMLIGGIGSTVRKIKEYGHDKGAHRHGMLSSLAISIVIFAVAALLSVSLFWTSPIMVEDVDWQSSGAVAAVFLHSLSEIVPQLPQNATVEILGLPWFATSANTRYGASSVTQLLERSVQSWLDINHPGNKVSIRIRRYANYLQEVPRDFDLQMWTSESGDEVKVKVKAVY